MVDAATRQPVSTFRFYPFGERRSSPGGSPTDRQFGGHVLDSYINMYLMGSRYYSPALGRFITPDSIIPDLANPQSLNRYAYAYNNPLTYVDPTGHDGEPFWAVAWNWAQQTYRKLQDTMTGGQRQAQQACWEAGGSLCGYVPSSPTTPSRFTKEAIKQYRSRLDLRLPDDDDFDLDAFEEALDAAEQLNAFSRAMGSGTRPNFANESTFAEHYGKHAGDLGHKSPADYLEGGRELASGRGSGRIDRHERENGDAAFMEWSTGRYAVRTKDGIIRTYMLPGNKNYPAGSRQRLESARRYWEYDEMGED